MEETPKEKTNGHWLQSLPFVMSHYDNDYDGSTHNREVMVEPSRYSPVKRQRVMITSASARDRASTRHRALPYHHISQSFDLPPVTTSVNHLTCPLPPHHQSELVLALEIELALVLDIEHYRITTSVSHLTCPLPPHQSVI